MNTTKTTQDDTIARPHDRGATEPSAIAQTEDYMAARTQHHTLNQPEQPESPPATLSWAEARGWVAPALKALTLTALTLVAFGAPAKDKPQPPPPPPPPPPSVFQTVDDFQYVPGYSAQAFAITLDPAGNLLVAGDARENSTILSLDALVQKSADGGSTWSISDNFSPTSSGLATYIGVTSDTAGNIYAVGSLNPLDGTGYYWLVRESADGGNTWSTIDVLKTSSTNSYYARSVSTDAAGNVYVAGYELGITNGVSAWIVRKGFNVGGSWSWTTVDSFSPYNYGLAFAVFCHPNGTVFVSGTADVAVATKRGTSIVQGWVTRRSLDGGNTWATVDSYTGGSEGFGLGADAWGNVYAVGIGGIRKSTDNGNTWTTVDTGIAIANGFSCDASGNLFVVGYSGSSNGSNVWTVRENPGGTGTWTTVDSYQLAAGYTAQAAAVTSDAAGHTYVAGFAQSPSGNQWIVRKH